MSHNDKKEKENLVKTLDLDLEDIYKGANKKFMYYRFVHCNKCQGQGKIILDEKINCNICKGLGINTIIRQDGNLLNEINVPCIIVEDMELYQNKVQYVIFVREKKIKKKY